MNLEKYECSGQVELTDYLKSIAPPSYCEDCIFLEENGKCGLGTVCYGGKSLNHADGWKRIKHHLNNTVSGEFPENMEWQEVNTFHYDKISDKYSFTKGFGKDKTFKWPKENQVPGDVYAWRYKN